MNGPFCDYTILDELGHGGMGTVYRARNAAGEIVALKVMAQNLARDKGLRERFLREPRMYPKHENIVQIMEAGECNGMPFFAMAYIEGESFDAVLQRHRSLAPNQFLPVLRDVAAALDHVHKQGIIHRDIKPSNILMRNSDDRAFLTDFGVAKNTLGTKLTQVSGVRIGTAHYMSPEQAMGKRDLTSAADIYALGVMAYHAISGRVPFDSDSDVVVARMHMQDPPPELRKVNPHISAALSAVVMRTLEKDPAKRYASAGAFAMAFAKAVDSPNSMPVAPVASRLWMGISAGVLAATALAAVFLLSSNNASNSSTLSAQTTLTITTKEKSAIVLVSTTPNPDEPTSATGDNSASSTASTSSTSSTPIAPEITSEATATSEGAGAATSTLAPTSTSTNTPRPPTHTPIPTRTPTETPTDVPTDTPTPSITPTPTITRTPKKVIVTRFPKITLIAPKLTLQVNINDSKISPTIITPVVVKPIVLTAVLREPVQPIATLVLIQPEPIVVATVRLRLPPIRIIVTKAP